MRLLLGLAVLAGCDPRATVQSERIPAPESSLARALHADEAGRGALDVGEDMPFCGPRAPRIDRSQRLGDGIELAPRTGYLQWSHTLGFFAVDRPPPPTVPGAEVALHLEVPGTIATNAVVHLTSILENRSARPQVLHKMIDGGFTRWRAPFVETYVRLEGSERIFVWSSSYEDGGPEYCMTLRPRTQDDELHLEPGQRLRDPFGHHAHGFDVRFAAPGRYEVWVLYTDCDGYDTNIGGALEEDMQRRTDRFTGPLSSNVVHVDVSNPW